MRFVFFSKTSWHEPPRLRHQLAELLVAHGHSVVFFQRPMRAGCERVPVESSGRPGITLARTRELIHHQLRIVPTLANLNAAYESRNIQRVILEYPRDFVVVNFNYDYYFLDRICSGARIISVFNDDFIAAARLSRRTAERFVRNTARSSAHNLAVSFPLVEQIKRFTEHVSLFLPWARRPYVAPLESAQRSDLLYWGYINDRIDYSAVEHLLASGIHVHFAGPIDGSRRARALVRKRNATYHGVKSLTELAPVVGRCAASILPYNIHYPQVAATTMSNRGFDLLSCGLALIYSDMPGLLRAPSEVIYRCQGPDDYVSAFRSARDRFAESQKTIRAFLEGHSSDVRYRQLMNIVTDGNANQPQA